MARKKKDSAIATISQGNHLTVRTYEDGRTELEWDDERLLQEVREAIASVETTAKKPKTSTRKKKDKNV